MFRNEINVTARAPAKDTMPPMSKQERMRRIIEQETEGWSPRQRAALLHRLGREATRLDARSRYPSAGALACSVDEKTVQTPALEAIDEAIEWALSTRDARLAISVPPQEGKTTRVGVWGTIRALVQDPDRRVVIASYSDSLARSTSRTARNVVRDHGTGAADPLTGAPLPDRIGLSLADDKSAAGNWKVAGHSGGCYAVGVGGSLTGQPADCVSPHTFIISDHGRLTAAEAHRNPPERILAYDHDTGHAVWRRLEATRRIGGRRMLEVHTEAGRVLTCTPDHRIHTGRGYVPARDLRPGEALLRVDDASGVPDVRRDVPQDEAGHPQSNPPGHDDVLRRGMQPTGHRGLTAGELLRLRQADTSEPEDHLFRGVPDRQEGSLRPVDGMSGMRGVVPAVALETGVLREGLRGHCSLAEDDRVRELEVHRREVVRDTVPLDAATDLEARQPQVRVLFSGERADGIHEERQAVLPLVTGGAPHRRGHDEQRAGEPDYDVLDVPRGAPQVAHDTVSRVVEVGDGTHDAYDFQVEGTRNFFADGLLVHNCLIVDDPLKGMAEADSKGERQKVIEWWNSVAQTRLAAGAPVIMIMTRWHEDDLVGHVTRQDPERWRVVNIPAVSEKGIPDALGREPGVAMESARGRTPEDYAKTRTAVGERVWSALYCGVPTPSGGGLFSSADFDRHRVPEIPAPVAARLVSVDPAETGKRDEAGVLGLSVTADSRVWITDDVSGRMQSDEWARAAVLLALRAQATEVVVEAYTTGQTYQRVVEAAWRRVRDEARLLRKANGSIEAATVAYAMSEDRPADPMQALLDVQALAVPDQADPPFIIKLWRGKGDKVARASGTRQAASTGRLRMVGAHPELEAQACFPAGTRIAVASGEKNIEDVKPGDQVRTRKGLRTVLARWDNGVRPTVQVNFDGGEVRCTPDHLVWSPGKDGWIEASSVMEYGTISTWHGLTLDPRSGSTGTSIASGTTATTSGTRAPSTSERDDASSCTEMYGNTTTDLSRKAWKSIMSTTTGETTTSATFGASVPQSTHQSTRTKGGLDGLARTEASAQTKCGEAGNPEKSSAPTAEPLSCQPECAPSTALCLAINATTGLEAGNKNVSATTQRSGVRSTNVHSVERTGRSERVYDLSVEGVHEFFANGVLVHNCTWLPGQDSPDRMDAMTQGYERAVQMVGGQAQIAAPVTTTPAAAGSAAGGFWSSTVG